jgi:hypothetical protein
MKMVRLAIDFENPAPEWWESGGRDLWESVAEGFDNNDVVLEESLARSWIEQAARIPGWDSGHEYAPHPVGIRELDPDEEV